MNLMKALQKEADKMENRLATLRSAISALGGGNSRNGRSRNGRKKHALKGRHKGWTMSAAAKAKIGRAQRARWKEIARRKKLHAAA